MFKKSEMYWRKLCVIFETNLKDKHYLPQHFPWGPHQSKVMGVARLDEATEPFHMSFYSKNEVETGHPGRVDPKCGLPTQLCGRKGIQRAQWNSRTKIQQGGRSASLSTPPECTNFKEGGWRGADLCSLQSQRALTHMWRNKLPLILASVCVCTCG